MKLEREKLSIQGTFFEEFNKDVISALIRLSGISNYEYKPRMKTYEQNSGHKLHTIIEIPLKKRTIRISREYYMKEWTQKLFSCEQFWNLLCKGSLVYTAKKSRKRHKIIEETFLRDDMPLKLKVFSLLNRVFRFERNLKLRQERSKSLRFIVAKINCKSKSATLRKKASINMETGLEKTLANHIYNFEPNNQRDEMEFQSPVAENIKTFNKI
jgi:hypothetical protein